MDVVQEMYRNVTGRDMKYVDTHGGSLVSMDERIWNYPVGFHYGGGLVDMGSHVDLSDLDGAFES
ncbi:hypothetical protein [Rhodococcus globerulus]|uniref:Uncharacterized protein n=1 Tax=Rhodococcus globerulus TaxID=33008 RepID=A0ABU4BU48_RHOGO|nr:hypothetical protein [Rhodococcus globerulus]MDV6267747.1 hypothetical protein [Rhodococcus globerulus]